MFIPFTANNIIKQSIENYEGAAESCEMEADALQKNVFEVRAKAAAFRSAVVALKADLAKLEQE